MTTHSFVDENNNPVIGAMIDLNSSEGQNFIDNEIINNDPNILLYAKKSYAVGLPLDFKSRKENLKDADVSIKQHMYWGSMTSDRKIASARDFGNMAAGIVSGRAGNDWNLTEIAFNTLQGSKEPIVSSKAQKVGWELGNKIYNIESQKIIPTLIPNWNMNHIRNN